MKTEISIEIKEDAKNEIMRDFQRLTHMYGRRGEIVRKKLNDLNYSQEYMQKKTKIQSLAKKLIVEAFKNKKNWK